MDGYLAILCWGSSCRSLLRAGVRLCNDHPPAGWSLRHEIAYGISCLGTTEVPPRVNSNRRIQVLNTPRPSTVAGLNFQSCAAARAARAKYLLGPRDSSSASSTLPERSTFTLTLTLSLPRMLFLAD